jgi:hypothetical protein
MEANMVMTTYTGRQHEAPLAGPLDAVRAAWSKLREQRAERRAAAQVARLGPRLVADIGLDPEVVRPDGWDSVRPNPLLVAQGHCRTRRDR